MNLGHSDGSAPGEREHRRKLTGVPLTDVSSQVSRPWDGSDRKTPQESRSGVPEHCFPQILPVTCPMFGSAERGVPLSQRRC